MKIIDINGMEREVQKVYPDPDYPGYMRIEFRRHHEWFTIDEFLEKNPDLKDLIKNAPKLPDDLVGVVTRSGPDFLIDKTLNLTPNTFLGFYCWISRGKGEGQKRTVVRNTKNQITVDKPWEVKPDKTSQYVLSHNVQAVRAMGNTLPQEDMKALEKRALAMDKKYGKLTSDLLKKNYKYLKPEEM